MSAPNSIAFFGATGGCTLAALVLSIQAGFNCTALVRSSNKLAGLLAARGVPQATLDAHLTIHEGNIRDVDAVRKTLEHPETGVHSLIVIGVGSAPKFSPNPLKPTLEDPTICESGTKSILTAIQAIRSSGKPYKAPYLCAISTTGIAEKRDIPVAMIPLYHWMLAVPHADKKQMEILIENAPKEDLAAWTFIHPALLMDGASKGWGAVRAGYEGRAKNGSSKWRDCEGVAVGYIVNRSDVGLFIFEEIIKGGGGEWVGKRVSLAN